MQIFILGFYQRTWRESLKISCDLVCIFWSDIDNLMMSFLSIAVHILKSLWLDVLICLRIVILYNLEEHYWISFWNTKYLENYLLFVDRGFDITYKSSDDSSLQILKYGEYLYDHIIVFAPSTKGKHSHRCLSYVHIMAYW